MFLISTAVLFILSTLCLFSAAPLTAEDSPPAAESKTKGVRVTTDQAVVDSKARYTEFKGNVSLTIDEEIQIKADWLKISYKPGTNEGNDLKISEKSFKDIIARGNVKIIFDDKVAITEEALYIPETETLTLTGENSKISTGNDHIMGDKITLNRKDRTFKVEGSGKKQVEVVFLPNP